MLHNTCPKLVCQKKAPTPGDSYVVVNGMSLVCPKETRDQQSLQSEVYFLLLQVNITGSIDRKELSRIP